MGKLTVTELLRQAFKAGLKVYTEGEKLVCEGPPRLEPIAREVLSRKPEVYPLVRSTAAFLPAEPRVRLVDNTEQNTNIGTDEPPAALDAPDTGRWARRAAALLANVQDAALRADLRFYFEERSAIAEFEGNASRDEAERLVLELLEASMRRGGLVQ